MSERKVWRRKRVAERVAVRLWVCLRGEARDLECTTLDLSRTGLRLRVRLEDVGLKAESGVFDLSRVITATIGNQCTAEVRPIRAEREVAGIPKPVEVVRIGLVRRLAGDFEVGCRFVEPLTDVEVEALGIALPGNEAAAG